MSPPVKTKRQANFKDFKRFGALRGSSNKKTLYSTRSCVNWDFLAQVGQFKTRFTRVLNWPTRAKKSQFTQELVK
jgi:hypothetical protein